MIIPRHARETLERLVAAFPAVLVTGARQTGKSTLYQMFSKTKDLEYVSFDDPGLQMSAKADPNTFLAIHPPPVVFDEIQYVPELFPYLKINIDTHKHKGMYFLTGSQQFHLMHSVSESLAGRIGILHLLGISMRERNKDPLTEPFIPSKEFLLKRKPSKRDPLELWTIIQGGSFPEVVTGQVLPQDFFASYIKTYVQRDVRALTQIADELSFIKFVTMVAARTGQLLNYASLAREIGVSEPTVKKWISVLVSSGLVFLLPPYSRNVEKRMVKTPKLYFLDTGLAAHLTRWTNPEVLMHGAMAGAYFETFVISEILKSFYNQGINPSLYFYRDKDGFEIDVLIEDNGVLYPVEIKKTATPQAHDGRHFNMLSRIYSTDIGPKSIICTWDKLGLLGPETYTVPVQFV